MHERGDIKYPKRYKQLISFTGMERRRNITPTDIDGFIDYNGNAFVYLECKLKNAPFDMGQRRAYENVCNSHKKAGNQYLVIVFEHNCPADEIIIAKEQRVTGVYFNDEWKNINSNTTVLDAIISFEKYCESVNVKL